MGSLRWRILVYFGGVLIVLGALAWLTLHALRLERAEVGARAQAKYQESIRLVLWRMDSALTPIVAREAARPHFQYEPFFPADRAYTRRLADVSSNEVLVPSPLLMPQDPPILLHFQVDGRGEVTSPEAPTGEYRALADAAYVSPYDVEQATGRLTALRGLLGANAQGMVAGAETPNLATQVQVLAQQGQQSEVAQSANEYAQRANITNRAKNVPDTGRVTKEDPERPREGGAQTRSTTGALDTTPVVDLKMSAAGADKDDAPGVESREKLEKRGPAALPPTASEPPVVQGDFVARWEGAPDNPQLIFVRGVSIGNERFEQGFWLDWADLRTTLLASASDLLPGATLRPVLGNAVPSDPAVLGRMLAAIPAELVVPGPPTPALPMWSPIRTTLVLAWLAAGLAAMAVGVVLRASFELAERRGRFVSAVTHELRTPLTTFCLYSQMLDDGMVTDESARKDYVRTLREESERLAGIVESVLEYARLGRRRSGPSKSTVRIGALLDQLVPLLASRCAQSGLEMVVERDAGMHLSITTDVSMVQRILTNLVENACKYARGAEDRRVHLSATVEDHELVIGLKDHGPGVSPADQARIFRPFVRGEAQAHGGEPGLGLGLALSRGLAGELGGELRLISGEGGAAFRLRMPLGVPRAG